MEAFPATHASHQQVAHALLKDIIPRFGIPQVLDSDQGGHFTSQVLQTIYTWLGITRQLHTPYHPQSSGGVERADRTLKTLLGKVCLKTQLKWPKALPLALFAMRNAPRADVKISPYELLFGHPPPITCGFLPPATGLLAGDENLTHYVISLQKQLTSLQRRAAVQQPVPVDCEMHPSVPVTTWGSACPDGDVA